MPTAGDTAAHGVTVHPPPAGQAPHGQTEDAWMPSSGLVTFGHRRAHSTWCSCPGDSDKGASRAFLAPLTSGEVFRALHITIQHEEQMHQALTRLFLSPLLSLPPPPASLEFNCRHKRNPFPALRYPLCKQMRRPNSVQGPDTSPARPTAGKVPTASSWCLVGTFGIHQPA